MASEIGYMLNAEQTGVETFEDSKAVIARVSEWLDTPVGEVWGSPAWGNNLKQYQHQPFDADTAAAMESSIASKLPADMPDITISFIRVDPVDIDLWSIKIGISSINDVLSKEVTL